MPSDIELQDLNRSLQTAFDNHGWKRKNRFYHLTTIQNFIYHLPKIKDKTKKQLAYDNLTEYLLIINSMPESEELDAKSGDELFSRYLQPLISIYEIRLGFIPFIRLPILLIFFLLAEAVAFGLKVPLSIHLIIDIVFLFYALYQLYKRKQKKIFGLFV